MNIMVRRNKLKRIPSFSPLTSIMSNSFSLVEIPSKMFNKKVAILYQEKPPPTRQGIVKPMKPGGYSDISADIAYCLHQNKMTVITPKDNPNVEKDFDWVFPDSDEGITAALKKSANILWLNTVLYEGHPIETYLKDGLEVVGQMPKYVELYDDKWVTNNYLSSYHIPIAHSWYVSKRDLGSLKVNLPFPVVLKPVRGRGIKGVQLIKDFETLQKKLKEMFDSKLFGEAAIVEEFLPGNEITVTVMPPGSYVIDNKRTDRADFWCLPAVKRLNHENGIAPYDDVVTITKNNSVLTDEELNSEKIKSLEKLSEFAAKMVHARAPVRIDWREDVQEMYSLFDFNMKPNNAGPARPHRLDHNSLVALSAKQIGWSYTDLVTNCLYQFWSDPT